MQYALQLFTEVEVASDGYLPLTTDTKVNSRFSIYYSTAQKDNSKSFILATITIFLGANPARVAQRWIAMDIYIRSWSSQSERYALF